MKRLINKLVCVGVVAFFLVMSMAIGIESAHADSSTFQYTCTDVTIESFPRPQPVLKANCRKRDQSSQTTYLGLRGIDNIDGNLTQNSLAKFSTFQLTCSSASINSATLSAKCLKIDQSEQLTSLPLQDIENIDGNLQYSQPTSIARVL